MTRYHVKSCNLQGEVEIPSSKSQTLRAILFGALAKGATIITNPLLSPDADAMVSALQCFGVEITHHGTQIQIKGVNGRIGIANDVIHAGNSGIVLRFISAVASLSNQPVVITGDNSLRYQRPMGDLLRGLSHLDVLAASTKGDGYAPVLIQGPLLGGRATLKGDDSQPVSALLIAGAFSEKGMELRVTDPGETPWVEMTLDWFDRLGLDYAHEGFRRYKVDGGQQMHGFSYQVPGDFSTAAFPIVAALITNSELTVNNLDFNDTQGDKQIIEVFRKMGAKIDIQQGQMHVRKHCSLKGIEIDINPIIDQIAPLAVLACFADGETVIRNGRVARTKECDRIRAISTELKKMGAAVKERDDGLTITCSQLKGASLQTYSDHRMAMALTIAAMAALGETDIAGIDCIEKTYPDFRKAFQRLGAKIEVAP